MQAAFFNDLPIVAMYENNYMHELFIKETSPNKVNLTVGAYRTEKGDPWVLPPVREAERRLGLDSSSNHEYLPPFGYAPFCNAATELLLGKDCNALKEKRATTFQCLSGTGSLRIGAEFLTKILGMNTIFVSDPTWLNHTPVFKSAGFTDIRNYTYYNQATHSVDFQNLVADLEEAPESVLGGRAVYVPNKVRPVCYSEIKPGNILMCRSVIVLHPCGHNPTGVDLTREQWIKIAEIMKNRGLFPFFDAAYLGFVSGDVDKDAWVIRYFTSQGMEMFIAQSFSKTMGLYNERIGSLTVVLKDETAIEEVRSAMFFVISANWLCPPSHGAKVVHMVLTDPELRKEWNKCIKEMWSRISGMRRALREHLEKLKTPGSWEHITNQVGLFSYCGLSRHQVAHLVNVHKVFLLKSGRMNICGLNQKNVEYVAKAIDDAVRHVRD